MTAVCENCAGEDDDLVLVWPATGSGEAAELWCESCRERYPNEPADEDENAS